MSLSSSEESSDERVFIGPFTPDLEPPTPKKGYIYIPAATENVTVFLEDHEEHHYDKLVSLEERFHEGGHNYMYEVSGTTGDDEEGTEASSEMRTPGEEGDAAQREADEEERRRRKRLLKKRSLKQKRALCQSDSFHLSKQSFSEKLKEEYFCPEHREVAKKCRWPLRNIPWYKRYYTRAEVAVHNTEDDCWVSWNWVVRDLTPLVNEFKGKSNVILANAGKDITHWFSQNGEFKMHINKNGTRVPYLPWGQVPHLSNQGGPWSDWYPTPDLPWWKDEKYKVGRLTKNPRTVRIHNTLIGQTVTLVVCEEDTLQTIMYKYLKFNSNAFNYTWKYDARKLRMGLTLKENGVDDFAARCRQLGLPEDSFLPTIFLHYNDTL